MALPAGPDVGADPPGWCRKSVERGDPCWCTGEAHRKGSVASSLSRSPPPHSQTVKTEKCFQHGGIVVNTLMPSTRGPWTAMPALIKVDEIRTKLTKKIRYKNYSKMVQFSGKSHSVSVQQPPKRPFSLGRPQLDEAMDQSGIPLGLMLRPTSICQGAICQV